MSSAGVAALHRRSVGPKGARMTASLQLHLDRWHGIVFQHDGQELRRFWPNPSSFTRRSLAGRIPVARLPG